MNSKLFLLLFTINGLEVDIEKLKIIDGSGCCDVGYL